MKFFKVFVVMVSISAGLVLSAGTPAEANGRFDAYGLADDSRGQTSISITDSAACSLDSAGAVRCWGRNASGQLGNGTTDNTATPSVVDLGSKAISAKMGGPTSCALLIEGAMKCWGNNQGGQVGNGSSGTNTSAPGDPIDFGANMTAVAFDMGYYHSCAILNDGSVKCWGFNSRGQLGDGTTTDRSTPTAVDLGANMTAVAISAGERNTCAILNDGSVKCWGENGGGQLGDGTTTDRTSPVAVDLPVGMTAVMISTAYINTCAVLNDGSLYCWGDNTYGQIGDGTTTDRLSPVQVGTDTWIGAVGNKLGTCGIKSDRSLWCWGYNGWGTVGDGTTTDRTEPVEVDLGANKTVRAIADIDAMNFNVCAILNDGVTKCWGENYDGYGVGGVFLGVSGQQNSPTTVSAFDYLGQGIRTIESGLRHSCAITNDGQLYCWGNNADGQVGNGNPSGWSTVVNVPLDLDPNVTAESVALGNWHTCAILNDGSVKCWGWNSFGQLGDGTTTDRDTPVSVTLGSEAVSITSGGFHTCVILADGELNCWGSNGSGEIGDGTTTDRTSPTAVDVGAGMTAVSVEGGDNHTCAILNDGSVNCWGENGHNQIGDGTETDRHTPTAVDLGANMTALSVEAAGRRHQCAVLNDRSVKCWGANPYGQVGDGTTTDRTSPTAVDLGANMTAVSISAYYYHTCAVLNDASVKCWGDGANGQIGDGDAGDASSPTSVDYGGNIEARKIAAGADSSCALLHDSVHCWGSNDDNDIGLGGINQIDSTRTLDAYSVSTQKRVAFTDDGLQGLVPNRDVEALVLNVKVFNPSQSGYLAVYNCDAAEDRVSALTLNKGETVQGAVISKVSAVDGEVCIEARDSNHNLIDVDRMIVYTTGYIGALSEISPVDPTRTIDVSSVSSEKRVVFTDSDLDGIVPETGVGALALNVKVFNPSQSGYLAVFNCDASNDRVSALTLNAGETVQGAVISKVSAGDGEVCVEARDSNHNPISVDRLIVYTTGYIYAPITFTPGFVGTTDIP